MLNLVRQVARKGVASCGRNVAAELALRLHRRPAAAEIPTVHMLVSSKTWHAGLIAAASFEHHTGRRWKFVIHDDGTVGAGARQRIASLFADARFVPRPEAEGRALEFLGHHPLCMQHRAKHNLFLKFFDFAAFAPGERFIVLDSDVIFFRKPEEILEWTGSRAETCFYNEDTKEKYCIPRQNIEGALGIRLWPRFNSGLVLLPAAAINLDLAERLLSEFETTAHHPQFFEQTLYALMASAWNRGGALPGTYEISWGYFRHRGAVCRHYVGDFKHDLLYIEGAPQLLGSMLQQRMMRRETSQNV